MKIISGRILRGSMALLMAAPILTNILPGMQTVFAQTQLQEVVKDQNAEISIMHAIDQENDQIHWTMVYEKSQSDETKERQMRFKLATPDDEALLIKESIHEAEGTFGKVAPIDHEWYYAGDFSSEAEEITITFKTRIIENQAEYNLQISPKLVEKEQITLDEMVLATDDSPVESAENELTIGEKNDYLITVTVPGIEAEEEMNTVAEETKDTVEGNSEDRLEKEIDSEDSSEEVEAAPFVAAYNVNDPNLNGAFSDAIDLSKVFVTPNRTNANTDNSAKLSEELGEKNKLYKLNSINDQSLLSYRSRAHIVSSTNNRINFYNMPDGGSKKFTTYMYFDQYAEGITFFMHDGGGTGSNTSGIYNMYDPMGVFYEAAALGVYQHGYVTNNNYMRNAMVLEFDNLGSNGFGDDTDHSHIVAAHSSAPSGNSSYPRTVFRSYTKANVFENGSWWKLDIEITKAGRLNFSMEDLTNSVNNVDGSIELTTYIGEKSDEEDSDEKVLGDRDFYWGFTSTKTNSYFNRTNNSALFITEQEETVAIEGELTHKITAEVHDGGNISGKTVSEGDTLDHTVTFKHESGNSALILKSENKDGISILSLNETDRVANSLDYTNIDSLSAKFVVKNTSGTTINEVTADYDGTNHVFYPASDIDVPIGGTLILTYTSTVKDNLAGINSNQVYDRVKLTGSLSDGSSFTEESETIAYLINRVPIVTVKTTDADFKEKAEFVDYAERFYFQFDYEDTDSDPLSYQVLINGKDLKEGKLEKSIGTYQFKDGIAIDLKQLNPIFKKGVNTIEVIVTDSHNAKASSSAEFKVTGYRGFTLVTKDYEWLYARNELPPTPTAQARKGPMEVGIRDTLNDSTTMNVTFALSDLTSESNGISKEQFVFQNNNGNNLLPVDGKIGLMLNVGANVFSANEGLLVKLSNQNDLGTYTGTITWTINVTL